MAVEVGTIQATLVANVRSFVQGMRQAQSAFQSTTSIIQGGGGALGQLQSQFNSVTSSVSGFTGALKNIKGVAVGGLAAIGAYNIIPGIFQAAKSALIDFNQQVDQSSIALTSFLGSATAANDMVKELQDFAAKTPFQFKDLLGTVQSMMALGVESKDVIPRMKAIGDAAAALGGTPEVMQRIQRALGQIQAKGRVQSEELLQLAEAGIPAYQYLADALGTTTADMLGDLRKGTVGAQVAIEAVLDGMSRDFGGMMEEQAKTMMGALSTVKDYVQITMGAITRPIFEAFRDSFVLIANFLGSEGASAGAKKFAEAIAGIIKSLQGGLAEAFNALKEPMTTIVKALVELGAAVIKLGKAIAPMASMIAAVFVGALIAVVKAVAPVIGAIGSLVKFMSEFKLLVQLVATILVSKWVYGMIQAQMASNAMGGAIVGLIGKMGAFGKIFKFQVVNNLASGMKAFPAFRQAAQLTFTAIATSAKAMGVAIAASLGPMILISIAVMAATKLFTAFSNRNKDAKERVSELTAAIKEQSDAMTGQNYVIQEFISGTDGLNRVLLQTGENGDRLATALSYLGETNAVGAIEDFQKNTYAAAKAMAMQKGETEAAASAIAAWVVETDKGSKETQRAILENRGYSQSQIELAMALEEVNDQAENTDLNEIAKSQVENIAKTNNFVKALRDQAMKTIDAKKATDKTITADTYYIKVKELLGKLIADYNNKQQKAALEANKMADGTHNAALAIQKAKESAKDGKVELEDLTKAIMGPGLAAIQTARSVRSMQLDLGGLLKNVKESKGNFEGLKTEGYKLFDMMMKNSDTIYALGGSTGDVAVMMRSMADQFIATAKSAGFSDEKVQELLKSLGLLDAIKNIETSINVNLEKAYKDLQAYTKVAYAFDPDNTKLGELREALAEAAASYRKTGVSGKNSFDAISDSTKSASGNTKTLADAQKMLEERIKNQKRAVVEARQALQDYARESASVIAEAVSVGSVYDRYRASQDKKEDIVERNKQIRAQMEADRVAKQRDDARKLVDSKNEVIDAENRLIEAQNQFAESVGSSISAVLSFNDVSSQQANAVNEYQSALERQNQAQDEANLAQAEYQSLSQEVALIQQKLSQTTGRYARRVLGEELVKAQEDANGALAKFTDAQSTLALATTEANTAQAKQITFLQGLEQQAVRAAKFGSIIQRLSEAGLSKDALSQIAGAGAEIGTTMGEELLAGGVEAIGKANEFSKQIIDEGKRVTGLFSQTLKQRLEYETYEDKPVYEKLGEEVGETFAKSLEEQSKKAKLFTEKVKTLVGMGLRGTQLEEVISAGVDAGTEIADSLIAAGADAIKQSVAVQDELKALSQKFGDELVPYFDQTGVLLAEALLKALQQKLANLPSLLKGKSGKEIADFIDNFDNISADIERDIASGISGTPSTPSGLTESIRRTEAQLQETASGFSSFKEAVKALHPSAVAQYTADGSGLSASELEKLKAQFPRLAATPFAMGGIVTKPTLGLVGEAGAEAVIPLNQLGNLGGNNYTITVNAGMGTNGAQVGAQIVEAIKKYEKSNGTRWRS